MFLDGIQVGKWTIYDKNGAVYKVTDMKEGKKKAKRTMIEWPTSKRPFRGSGGKSLDYLRTWRVRNPPYRLAIPS